MKVPVMGSLFGGCTCGEPLTAGVPCHHLVAVVKSSRMRVMQYLSGGQLKCGACNIYKRVMHCVTLI